MIVPSLVSLVYTVRCVAAGVLTLGSDDGTERSILVASLTRALTYDASDNSTSTMDAHARARLGYGMVRGSGGRRIGAWSRGHSSHPTLPTTLTLKCPASA